MFRFIRFLIGLALLAGLALAAVTVPLGEKTLWQHIQAIAGSPESKKLVDGVKKKASKVIDGKRDHASDQFTPDERKKLRKLIRDRLEDEKPSADSDAKK